MQGAPQWLNASGSSSVLMYDQHFNLSPSPTLFVLGDSICEGYALNSDALRWVSLLRGRLGNNQVLSSCLSGGTAAGSLPRLQAELTYLRPKNVLTYLSTNTESNFATAIQALVTTARAAGANVGVATIPTSSANTSTVKGLTGVRVVNFDLALTASGAGSALIASDYTNTDQAGNSFNDNTHPNAAGDAAMFQRVLIDWPELAW